MVGNREGNGRRIPLSFQHYFPSTYDDRKSVRENYLWFDFTTFDCFGMSMIYQPPERKKKKKKPLKIRISVGFCYCAVVGHSTISVQITGH